MPKSVPKSIQTCFTVIFSKKFCAQCSMEGRVFENFQIFFFSKFQKCPKSFPKVSKRVLNVFWGKLFQKFCPVFHGGSNLRKISKKSKKNSKFQKRPKWFPKEYKRVLIVIWDNFSGKNLPSFPWKVESSKFFKKIKKFSKFQKRPKSFPKVSKRVLNKFWGKLLENFLPSFPWKVESSKIFKKIKKIFKIPKMPKIVPKSIQTCFELVLGQIFRKFFCPVFHGMSSLRKFSKKNISKFQKCPKVFPKVSTRVLG